MNLSLSLPHLRVLRPLPRRPVHRSLLHVHVRHRCLHAISHLLRPHPHHQLRRQTLVRSFQRLRRQERLIHCETHLNLPTLIAPLTPTPIYPHRHLLPRPLRPFFPPLSPSASVSYVVELMSLLFTALAIPMCLDFFTTTSSPLIWVGFSSIL